MNRERSVGGIFVHSISLIAPILGIVYALVLTSKSAGIYSTMPIPMGTTHKLTVITLCLSFLIYYSRLKFLYPLARLVTCLTIVVSHIHIYDFLWSVQSRIIRGTPMNAFSFIVIMICMFVLYRIDKFHGIFKFGENRLKVSPFLLLMLIGFLGMLQTGFWTQMNLVDSGVNIDPNRNLFWVLSKIPSFFLLLPYLEYRNIEAPLVLDPRVITW